MKRSTNTAPVSLSTSYLIGSPRIGISMITLQSLGTSLPAGTRSRLMAPLATGSGETGIAAAQTAPRRGMLPDMPRITHLGLAFVALMFALTGVAHAQKQPVPPFSKAQAGGPLPSGWQPLKLSSLKRLTEYKLV